MSPPSVVVYRAFDEPQVVLAAPPSADDLAEAVARSSLPTVVDFSENTTDDVFGNKLPKALPPPPLPRPALELLRAGIHGGITSPPRV